MPTNPFGHIDGQRPPSANDEPAWSVFAVDYAAAALWDLMAELPNKDEATLAQRRLEESVFWAKRAAEPAPEGS